MRYLPLLCLAACSLQRFEYREEHMGTPVRVVLYAPDRASADAAAREAFAEVARLDAMMSDWRADSELSRLKSGDEVSAGLADVLRVSLDVSEKTDGAFDPTVGPVVALWRRARHEKRLPDDAALAEALERTGFEKLELDGRRVRLLVPGMKLDLGGIAKGYAADRALAVLRAAGLEHALVAAGGDLSLGAPPPGRAGWRVDVAGGSVVELARCGAATSGDVEQFVEVGGRRYSHVVDPRTGMGVERMEAVTVIASDGTRADAVATAMSVLGPVRGMARAEELGVEVRFQVRYPDGTRRVAATSHFPPSPTGGTR